jgi:hypothetical protein
MTAEQLAAYPASWAERQFGPEQGLAIGSLLTRYSQLAARRKPELLDADTYDLASGEWDRVEQEWRTLRGDAEAIEKKLSTGQRDAFFQLVLHPILANGNLHELYAAVARNRLYARQRRPAANAMADQAQAYFALDARIRQRYEVDTANGKWTQMMAQTHIGYTGWQQPAEDVMPAVTRIEVPAAADMGVAPANTDSASLPVVDRWSGRDAAVEVFNRGAAPFSVRAQADANWVRVSPKSARINGDKRFALAIDWARAPRGRHQTKVTFIASTGQRQAVTLAINNIDVPRGAGFVEASGVIAIDAEHHAKAVPGNGASWLTIPNLGRTTSGVTMVPAALPAIERPGGKSAHLAFPIHLAEAGPINVQVQVSPGLDFRGRGQQRYAVSIDGGPPVIVNTIADQSEAAWGRGVAQNMFTGTSRLEASAGRHILKVWAVDPALVFQRILLYRNALPAAYLGPPESVRR